MPRSKSILAERPRECASDLPQPNLARTGGGRLTSPRTLERSVMKFSELATYLDQLEGTSSRNELVRILSELYRACSTDVVEPITYLIQGRLAPFFVPIEIGLAERLLMSAIAMAYGTPKEEITSVYRQVGDLGVAAERLAPKTTHESPSVTEVHQRLAEIAGKSGTGSPQSKLELFAGLLGEVDPVSAKHLVRITLGKMRLGIG